MTFENEGEQQSQSDVTPETSSESHDAPAAEAKIETPEGNPPEAKTSDSTDNLPFHKHPRWIERDNELKTERQARQELEKRYQDMERKLGELSRPKAPAAPDKRSQMIEKLKTVDPEFAEFMAGMASQDEIKALREAETAREAETQRTGAVTTINSLHEQFKVPKELRDVYNSQFEAQFATDPKKFLGDVKGAYQTVHESLSKILEAIKRQDRESYVASKKTDAAAPVSQSKGAPAKGNSFQYSKDPDEARHQAVQKIAQQMRAARNA